ncbi:MAG: hypothetical protein BWX88_02212 [Planctomycetes bacterium ADurb.Bin126]|nr:MAG: hypothetical protein BWX88_02212 [Planctomycetes bacterium ADurb.Bin126]HOD79805.1 hypothetical protein [Phycisphaerae bacterium]HQL72813.1 hypothetical protein [Phycisphaerae bacterium]
MNLTARDRVAAGPAVRRAGRLVCAVLLCLCARTAQPQSGPAGAAIELSVAPTQVAGNAPYRLALLRVTVPAGQPLVRAVRLREAQGGPTILQPLTVPPESTQTALVPLPAWSQQHAYRVELLAEDRDDANAILPARQVALSWPADILDRDAVFAPWQYEPYQELPRWPAPLLRNVFLAAALFALACTGLLLVRRPLARSLLLIVLAALAGAGTWLLLDQAPLVVHREVARDGSSLHVLTSRRTVQWSVDQPLWPVYFNLRQMRDDSLVVHVGRATRLTLLPDDVRILRPGPPISR